MASEGKLKIKVESETSEVVVELKEAEKVEALKKTMKRVWADETETIILYHQGEKMSDDQPLSAYNLVNGSVIKFKVSTDP